MVLVALRTVLRVERGAKVLCGGLVAEAEERECGIRAMP